MIEAIKEIFMAVGMCVVAVIIYGLFCAIIDKFNRWRKNGCKIKCLCKPHKYKLVWYQLDTEKAILDARNAEKENTYSLITIPLRRNLIWRISKWKKQVFLLKSKRKL
nr:MAG TPA: hypothetical protein [Herelleviridae sp.]